MREGSSSTLPSELAQNSKPKFRDRSGPRKLLTWFGLSVLAVLLAELFLRVYSPVPMLPRYVASAEYGVRMNMPDQTYAHTTPDYRIVIQTNSKGIRSDSEIPYDKPRGTKRIVALGDSFLMGYGAHSEEMLLNVMIDRLREAGHEVELVNMAVSGFGNTEELVALQAEGMKYEPDLVLIGWHATDIDDNVRSGLFELRDGKLVRAAETFLPAVKSREFLFRSRVYRFLAGSSQLYNWFRDQAGEAGKTLLANIRDAQSAATQAKLAPPSATPEVEAPEEGIQGATEGPSHAEALTLAVLQEIQRVSHDGGAELVLIDIPVRLNRTSFRSEYPSAPGFEDFNLFAPLPAFEEREGDLLYWERSHGHLTPLGNRIVGDGAAQLILERNLLGSSRTP